MQIFVFIKKNYVQSFTVHPRSPVHLYIATLYKNEFLDIQYNSKKVKTNIFIENFAPKSDSQ